MHNYLVLKQKLKDMKAATQLLHENFNVIAAIPAPFGMGLIYKVSRPIPDDLWTTLGVVPWE